MTHRPQKVRKKIHNLKSARAKGKARWVRRYERNLSTFKDHNQAAKQTLMDFEASPRQKNPHIKKLIREDLEDILKLKSNRK